MSKVQTLRAFVKQRLAAAAEEIFERMERTMAEYEEEVCRQHRLLDAAFRPTVRLHRAVIQQRLVSKAVVPPELQEWSPRLETESGPPELHHIQEEQQRAPPRAPEDTPVTVKSVEDDEDELQPSLLHQSSQNDENREAELLKTEADGEDGGGPEPAGNFSPDKTSSIEPENDDSCDWDDTREPQSGLKPLQSHEEPLFPTNAEMKGDEEQRQQPAASKKKHMVASSSDDEDSDVEKNFALLTGRGGGGAEEADQHHEGEEEEELSDDEEDESDGGGGEEEEEEGSDAGEEESDGGEEEEEEEMEGEEEEEDSEASVSDGDDGDEDPEEAGCSSEIQTREDIKKELSNMSFEDILKLQNKVGTKVYNEVAYGSDKSEKSGKKKRLNKNRPMEISAKRPAPFLRQVVSVRKPMFRDPRFDDLSGEYKPEIFEKTFKFISDIKHREKEIVQKQLHKAKNNHKRKEKLQFLLKRMENQERARTSREQQRERELHFKRLQRERANQGARPFFLKNSEKKKLQLAEKYQELKKSGKLENFLSKKRKRNAGKDRRKLPKQAA